jgi:hypothetical protein
VIAGFGSVADLFLKEIPLHGGNVEASADVLDQARIATGRITPTGLPADLLTEPGTREQHV